MADEPEFEFEDAPEAERLAFFSYARRRTQEATDRLPGIGDTVHYKSYSPPGGEYVPECRAAIVTAVDLGLLPMSGHTVDLQGYTASLAVLNPTGLFFAPDVDHDESREAGGTWHWPEAS